MVVARHHPLAFHRQRPAGPDQIGQVDDDPVGIGGERHREGHGIAQLQHEARHVRMQAKPGVDHRGPLGRDRQGGRGLRRRGAGDTEQQRQQNQHRRGEQAECGRAGRRGGGRQAGRPWHRLSSAADGNGKRYAVRTLRDPSSYSPANSTLSTRIVRSRVNCRRGCRSCNTGPAGGRPRPDHPHVSVRRNSSPNRRISALCKRDRLSMVSLRQTAIRQIRAGIPRWAPISLIPGSADRRSRGRPSGLRRRPRPRPSGRPRRRVVAGWRVRIGGERTKPRSWLWPQGGSPARVHRSVLAALVSAVRRLRSVAPYASPTTDAASRRPDRSRGFPGSRR